MPPDTNIQTTPNNPDKNTDPGLLTAKVITHSNNGESPEPTSLFDDLPFESKTVVRVPLFTTFPPTTSTTTTEPSIVIDASLREEYNMFLKWLQNNRAKGSEVPNLTQVAGKATSPKTPGNQNEASKPRTPITSTQVAIENGLQKNRADGSEVPVLKQVVGKATSHLGHGNQRIASKPREPITRPRVSVDLTGDVDGEHYAFSETELPHHSFDHRLKSPRRVDEDRGNTNTTALKRLGLLKNRAH